MILFLPELFLIYASFKVPKSVKNSLSRDWLFRNVLSVVLSVHSGWTWSRCVFFLWVWYTDFMFSHQSRCTRSGCEGLSHELSPEVMYVTLRITVSLFPYQAWINAHLFILFTWLCVIPQEINQLSIWTNTELFPSNVAVNLQSYPFGLL